MSTVSPGARPRRTSTRSFTRSSRPVSTSTRPPAPLEPDHDGADSATVDGRARHHDRPPPLGGDPAFGEQASHQRALDVARDAITRTCRVAGSTAGLPAGFPHEWMALEPCDRELHGGASLHRRDVLHRHRRFEPKRARIDHREERGAGLEYVALARRSHWRRCPRTARAEWFWRAASRRSRAGPWRPPPAPRRLSRWSAHPRRRGPRPRRRRRGARRARRSAGRAARGFRRTQGGRADR